MADETSNAVGAPETEFTGTTQQEYRDWKSGKTPAVSETVTTEESAVDEDNSLEEADAVSGSDSATDEETTEEQQPEKQPESKPGKKSASDRIRELNAKAKAAEERATAIERELQQYRSQQRVETQPATPKAQETTEEKLPSFPKLDDFDFDTEKHSQAVQEWIEKRDSIKESQRERQRLEAARQQEAQQKQATLAQRFQQATDRYPDFAEIALSADVPVTQTMAEAIADEDNSADIAYHLGKNRTEAQRISALSPARQLVEIGKLSVRLSTPQKPATTKPAPKPPSTVSASTGNTPTELGSARSQAEYRELRARLLSRS